MPEATGPEVELGQAAILLREGDDVAVAKKRLAAGTVIVHEGKSVRLGADVPAGHKFALREVSEGAPVRKYGQVIGYATAPIRPGDWVHTQNLGFGKGEGEGAGALHLDYEYSTEVSTVDYYPPEQQRTFPGYARPDGRVGTRNYIALVSTVNCSANTVQAIADKFRASDLLKEFPGVDGVIPVTHKTGCGQHLGGPDYEQLQRTLAGMADHPNVGGYLLSGLGCEVNQALTLAQNRGLIRPDQISAGRPQLPPVVVIQDEGGVRKAVHRGIEETLKLLRRASEAKRTPQPLSGLIVGTNCGGSDGNSGITANPALGVAGDEFVRHGAGWVLAETTETYGAEHLLTRRAVSREVGEKLVALMRWWEWYTSLWGATIDANPAPGNKEGGLTTIYEKSLGAVAKGGSMPLVEVYRYAERIDKKGFTFMDTPGHDPVSVTGLAAGGCNLIAFTTGRGSCLGFKPSPVLKIATNTPLYQRMEEDMDIDAGVILNGVPIADVGHQIFEALVAVAGGQKTKSEAQGFGENEFAPWMLGPVM
ncbi:MAG TPA: altronate dehydratase family protein [Chthonomonadaceae bacterium]|nr:altronate dehydratase family protein [Chthonomonadaceae bacterium]